MPEHWAVYAKDQAAPRCVCLVDFGVAQDAPVAELPVLATIAVRLQAPTAEGLNTEDESDRLNPIEDSLQELLAARGGQYVGRSTQQGTQTFYYYLPKEDEGLPAAVAALAADHAPYELKLEQAADPEWNRYFDDLAPSELELHMMQTVEMIAFMEENGDDGSEPRPVEHRLFFATPDDRDAFKERLRTLDYEIADEWNDVERAKEAGQLDDLPAEAHDKPLGLALTRTEPVELENIVASIRQLSTLAAEAGGSYDGWETEHCGDEPDEDHECGEGCDHDH